MNKSQRDTATNSLPILHKIFNGSQSQAAQAIWQHYEDNNHTLVSFLYFANAMKYRLFEKSNSKQASLYKDAMSDADFILPDGIALEVFYRVASMFHSSLGQQRLTNLNGTDFIPYFLKHIVQKHKQDFHVAIYSTYDPVINKTLEQLEQAKQNFEQRYHKKINFSFAHNYRDPEHKKVFPFEQYQESLDEEKKKYKLFLTCIGTPHQEIRIENNKEFFKKNNILVFNAGGFVDFLAGYEKRAPEWVINARVLETFWRITKNPKKNFKKFAAMFGVVRFLAKKLVPSNRKQ